MVKESLFRRYYNCKIDQKNRIILKSSPPYYFWGMNSNSLQLKTGYRDIMGLAFPITASLLIPQINFITNLVFLGSLGEEVLAMAGITGVYYLIFSVIGHGLNSGLQALISRRAGENNPKAIGTLFSQGILIAIAISVISILFTLLVSPYIFRALMVDEKLVQMTNHFLSVRIWGLPLLLLYQLRNALLVGINQSKFLMVGTAVETLFNIVFDYGLIYGKLNMPEMGYIGAAYASIIAEFAGLVVIAFIVQLPSVKNTIRLQLTAKPDFELIWSILTVSFPLIVQFVISVVAWEFFYISMEHYGERELAISSLVRTLFGFFGSFTWAFASATTTMVSNVMGQGKKEEVIPVTMRIMKLSVGFACLWAILLLSVPKIFFTVFSNDVGLLTDSVPIIRIVALALVIMSISCIWLNAVVGTGNTRITLLAELISISLYVGYVFLVTRVFHLSLSAAWMSEWVYWSTLFFISFLYMKKGQWALKTI